MVARWVARGWQLATSNHNDRLNYTAIALQQRIGQRSFGIILFREQPLLELVDYQQQLAALGYEFATTYRS